MHQSVPKSNKPFIEFLYNLTSVTFDESGKIGGLPSRLQDAPYKILKDKSCRSKTKKYPIVENSGRKYIDGQQVLCAVEQGYKSKKIAGQKTKLCYVSATVGKTPKTLLVGLYDYLTCV